MSSAQYYIFYKPYGVLSQFTKDVPEHITLQDFLDVERDVYPVGRLDKDSEGLLLLTNDNAFKNKILDPKNKKPKTYWVQVDGDVTEEARSQLSRGVRIKVKKGYYDTQPAAIMILDHVQIEDRDPPVRYRAHIPTSWLEFNITEGKNRQVRKMCSAVNFPCLRLIRVAINGIRFPDLQIGQYRPLKISEVTALLD